MLKMSINNKTRKIARGRLTEKLNRVKDVQIRLEDQLSYLRKLKDGSSAMFKDVSSSLEQTFEILKEKEEALLVLVKDMSERSRAILAKREKIFEDIFQRSSTVSLINN